MKKIVLLVVLVGCAQPKRAQPVRNETSVAPAKPQQVARPLRWDQRPSSKREGERDLMA